MHHDEPEAFSWEAPGGDEREPWGGGGRAPPSLLTSQDTNEARDLLSPPLQLHSCVA